MKNFIYSLFLCTVLQFQAQPPEYLTVYLEGNSTYFDAIRKHVNYVEKMSNRDPYYLSVSYYIQLLNETDTDKKIDLIFRYFISEQLSSPKAQEEYFSVIEERRKKVLFHMLTQMEKRGNLKKSESVNKQEKEYLEIIIPNANKACWDPKLDYIIS